MREVPLPAVAVVISFIDAINRGDIDRLGELMTEDHHLDVFNEPPLRGKIANIDGWRGYVSAYPTYVIYPHQVAERDGDVACWATRPGHILGNPTAKK